MIGRLSLTVGFQFFFLSTLFEYLTRVFHHFCLFYDYFRKMPLFFFTRLYRKLYCTRVSFTFISSTVNETLKSPNFLRLFFFSFSFFFLVLSCSHSHSITHTLYVTLSYVCTLLLPLVSFFVYRIQWKLLDEQLLYNLSIHKVEKLISVWFFLKSDSRLNL